MEMEKARKHKIQLDFSEEAFNTLQYLKKCINASTNAEVFRHSLGVLKWVIEEKSKGKRILVESDEEVRELIFPFLISSEVPSKRKESALV